MNRPFTSCREIGSLSLAACGLALALCGCGPSQATVRGKVTYQNKPLSSGEVHLVGEKGMSRSALIDPVGAFEVKDAPIGQVKVAVVSYKGPAGQLKGPIVGKKKADEEPEEIVPRQLAIPEKYKDVKTSELAYTISSGTQTIAIDLKD